MNLTRPSRVAAALVIALAIAGGILLAVRGSAPTPAVTGEGRAPPSGVPVQRPATPPVAGGSTDAPAAAGEDAARGGFDVLVRSGTAPVEGAEVKLYGRSVAPVPRWEPAGSANTGADGKVFLPASPGAYLLSASAPGRARALHGAVRPAGEDRTPVVLELGTALTLSGRVVERKGGEPIPFATVSVAPVRRGPGLRRSELPAEERAAATTDERGRFRIQGLAAGRLAVEARAVGHAPARAADVAVPRAAELVLEMADAGILEGIVTRQGRPVAGATVSVFGAGEPVRAETGAGGGFAVEVEPGLHRATARLGAETGAAPRAVPVAAGGTTSGVEIALGPPASIAGRVRAGAAPVRGAVVVATPRGDPADAVRATADADGSYAIRGLAPGAYGVTVSAAGLGTAQVPTVNLRSGDRFVLDVALLPPTAVEGTVTDVDGRPVAGALVTADGQGFRPGGGGAGAAGGPLGMAPGGAAVAARTGVDGRFRLEGVSPGPVRVSARRDLLSPAAVRTVTVEEGETASVELALVEGGVVAGVVLDTAGNPVPGARVFTAAASGPPRPGEIRQADADASGAFLLALVPGSYALVAVRLRGSPRFTGRPAPQASVELAAGQRVEVSLVLPEDPPPTLAGRVLEPGAAPASGANVWIGAPGAGLQVTQADAEGTFSLAPPAAAEVRLSARNGGRTGSVTVTPPASDLVVQLQPAAILQGRLVGEPPPETFTVSVSSRGFLAGGGVPEQQFADARFELDDVAPGAVSLHVRTSDGRVGDAQVQAAAGETRAVDVPLSAACTVTGRLVDAVTGKPVTRARILVDGVASRRYGVGAGGQFTRITSEGEHQLSVAALGYAPRTLPIRASGPAVDLGDVPMTPAGPGPRP